MFLTPLVVLPASNHRSEAQSSRHRRTAANTKRLSDESSFSKLSASSRRANAPRRCLYTFVTARRGVHRDKCHWDSTLHSCGREREAMKKTLTNDSIFVSHHLDFSYITFHRQFFSPFHSLVLPIPDEIEIWSCHTQKKLIFLLSKPPASSHPLCARDCSSARSVVTTIECAEGRVGVMEKWVGNGATVLVNLKSIVVRLGVNPEDAILHPHVIITKILEHNSQHHISITSQSVAREITYNICVFELLSQYLSVNHTHTTHSWMKSFPNQKSFDKSPKPCL